MFLFTDRPEPKSAVPAPGNLAPVLRAAADRTGAPFSYLVETARRESGMKPDARAATSSARGLFQFIEQTWLSLVRSDGTTQGLSAEAARISMDARGRLTVSDAAERMRILNLRNDPDIASRFAGVLAQKNRGSLSASLGREPTQGELYIAHFLGPAGASDLIRLKERVPQTQAAAHFPRAAAANRSIFYERSGEGRTVAAVYDRLVKGFEAQAEATTAIASAPSPSAPFHALFRTSNTPVSGAVARAWLPLAQGRDAGGAANAGAIGRPLDLLAFSRAKGRAS